MTNKKVLHLINGEFYSGAERVQDLLALRLPECGFDVGFACLKPKQFLDCRQSKNAPLYAVPMKSRFDLSPVKEVARLLEEQHYDILHTHTPRAALVGRMASQRTGIPLIHHVHSPTRRDTENRFRNLLNTAIENWSLARTRKLIAVSRSLRLYLEECGFPDESIIVVPNGVPILKNSVDWQKPAETWIIGTVALFRPRKGLEVLLEAISLLIKKGLSVRLRAVGGFETAAYEHSIQALVRRLGLEKNIDWIGFTQNVKEEFEKMDMFVLPSLYGEGLPMVVLEAMSCGLPVVSTDVEGIPEVLGAKEAGVIVEPQNSLAMADGIESLIRTDGLAARIAQTGHARQRDLFSDVAMARGVAQAYREVLK